MAPVMVLFSWFACACLHAVAVEVSLEVYAPHAASISVHGDFSSWRGRDLTPSPPMWRATFQADVGSRYMLRVQNQTGCRTLACQAWVLPPSCRESDGVQCFVHSTASVSPLQQPDEWKDGVVYELHVPTFSPNGTFAGVIDRLPYLKDLGITALELMPVTHDAKTAWGYSPQHLYAISRNLGGYSELLRLVDRAHRIGLAVLIDVVYNHADTDSSLFRFDLSAQALPGLPASPCPENSYQQDVQCPFGSYFYQDERALTPWGPRFNYSSQGVSDHLISNAKFFLEEVGADGLRLDATVCIRRWSAEDGAECWGEQAAANVDGEVLMRALASLDGAMIAEDLQGDPTITTPIGDGGYGFSFQWSDDLYYSSREALAGATGPRPGAVAALRQQLEAYCASPHIAYTSTHDLWSGQEGKMPLPQVANNAEADPALAQRRAFLPQVVALTSCGLPMLFQGSELLIPDVFDYEQPPAFPWWRVGRWEPGCGLTTHGTDHDAFVQLRRLAWLRRGIAQQLSSSHFRVLAEEDSVLAFARGDAEAVVVVLNFGSDDVELGLGFSRNTEDLRLAFSTEGVLAEMESDAVQLKLPPFSASVLVRGLEPLVPELSSECKAVDRMVASHIPAAWQGYFGSSFWTAHFLDDLWPFWSTEQAVGSPVGDFPTFRCDDGTAFHLVENNCSEVGGAPGWISDFADGRAVAVQHSRQVFFYSVMFHVTGNQSALALARSGAYRFLEKFLDGEDGAIFPYVAADGAGFPKREWRSSMEHANALIGLALYVYVSHDPHVADFIWKSHQYAFDTWWREEWSMMGQAMEAHPENPNPSVPVSEEGLHARKDLLAQLDYLNAYMMILHRIAPASTDFENWMKKLALALQQSFWSDENVCMWGNANVQELDTVHSDFAHSQKSLWFVMMVAAHFGLQDLEDWAYRRALQLLSIAWVPKHVYANASHEEDPDVGIWAFDRGNDGAPRMGHVWWVYAELSQTAAFMSMVNPSIASSILARAYDVYTGLFVDRSRPDKGVFHWVDFNTRATQFAKAHIWKNGFHEAEQAMIAHLIGHAMRSKAVLLWYAPALEVASGDLTLHPHFFRGERNATTEHESTVPGHRILKVEWHSLNLFRDQGCAGVLCGAHGYCLEGACVCMHGWSGPSCQQSPCGGVPRVVPSDRCGQCEVTFEVNPLTLRTHKTSWMSIAGNFTGWFAQDMVAEEGSDVAAGLRKVLEGTRYAGIAAPRYTRSFQIQDGERLEYKFVVDGAEWLPDACNPMAQPDGQNPPGLNSILDVTCAAAACPSRPSTPSGSPAGQNAASGVVVQLWEWTFRDVAQECTSRLGAEGWAAVQLSPVLNHLVLSPTFSSTFNVGKESQARTYYPWWQRYQPVDFQIHSRGGSEDELAMAVDACAAVGVQVWVEIVMNQFTAVECCDDDAYREERGLPSCEGVFSSDRTRACGPLLRFDSAGMDADDFHVPRCSVEAPGTWGSPETTWNCDVTGLPDVNTGRNATRDKLAGVVNRLLDLGIAGFRVAAAGHHSPDDLQAIFKDRLRPVREDIQRLTGALPSPTVIMDLWVSWLTRYPFLQPSYYPEEMTPKRYIVTERSLATDPAWQYTVAQAFYGKVFPKVNYTIADAEPGYPNLPPEGLSLSLRDLTERTVSERFTHPVFRQKADGIPTDNLVLQLNNHFANAYSVWECPEGVEGTSDVTGKFHERVCPTILGWSWGPARYVAATAWMLAMPLPNIRVFSSYEWQRAFTVGSNGYPIDQRFGSGPPRTWDGATLPVDCSLGATEDVTPHFFDDGMHFVCEHRQQAIRAMVRWRLEVGFDGDARLLRSLNSWDTLEDEASLDTDLVVSFGRSKNARIGLVRRAGWIAVNAQSDAQLRGTFRTSLPPGSYCDEVIAECERRVVVDARGTVTVDLDPMSIMILHTGAAEVDEGPMPISGLYVVAAILLVLLPALAFFAAPCMWPVDVFVRGNEWVVQENGIIAELLPHRHLAEDLADTGSVSEHSIVVASLEHAIPALGIRHNAGGLGKVLEIMQRYHPGHVTQILPMFGSEAPYLYTSEGERRPDVVERESIDIGFRDPVRVYEHTQEKGSRGIRIQSRGISFLMLHHEYLERLDLDLYPCPGRSTNHFLSFFRAWNMAVALLVKRLREEGHAKVYHCPDYHTALVGMYFEQWGLKHMPTLVVLHNASYQGVIPGPLFPDDWARVAKLLGVTIGRLMEFCNHEGSFNMLKAAVVAIKKHQNGVGVCGVSKQYAQEARLSIAVLRSLNIDGLPNPELMLKRPSVATWSDSTQMLNAKREACRKLQEQFGLMVDPNMKIAVFIGRWAHQKGVDIIADAAAWMLDRYKDLQLVVLGPTGDIFGTYAHWKFKVLRGMSLFEGRLYVVNEFVSPPPELQLAATFCLMPSRTEPFGYVDVEFAWHGALTIAPCTGGLGKVPGIYYNLWDTASWIRGRKAFQAAIARAMEVGEVEREKLGWAALHTCFPVRCWQEAIAELYKRTLTACGEGAGPTDIGRCANDQPGTADLPDPVVVQTDRVQSDGLLPVDVTGRLEKFERLKRTQTFVRGVVERGFVQGHAAGMDDVLDGMNLKRGFTGRLVLQRTMDKFVLSSSVGSWLIFAMTALAPMHSVVSVLAGYRWLSSATGWAFPTFLAVASAAYGVSACGWLLAATRFPPPRLLSVAVFGQLANLLYLFAAPDWSTPSICMLGVIPAIFAGATVPLFNGFAFADQPHGDVQFVSRNMLIKEPASILVTALLLAGIVQGNTSSMFMAMYAALSVAIVVCGFAMLALSDKFWDLRVPAQVVWLQPFKNFGGFALLVAASCAESLASYAVNMQLVWVLSVEPDKGYAVSLIIAVGVASAVLVALLCRGCQVMASAPKWLPVVGLLLPPPIIVSLIALGCAPYLSSEVFFALFVAGFALQATKRSAASIILLQFVPTRWSWTGLATRGVFFSQLCAAASPFLQSFLAEVMGLPLPHVGAPDAPPEGVALTLLMTSWPLCLIAYVLQVLAFPRYVLESQQIGSKHLRLCRHRHAPPLKPRISSPSRPRNAAELSAAGESRREAKEHRESGGFAGHETPSVTTSED